VARNDIDIDFFCFLSEAELASEDTTSHGVGTLKPSSLAGRSFTCTPLVLKCQALFQVGEKHVDTRHQRPLKRLGWVTVQKITQISSYDQVG
jgi:hypothetical protein